MNVDLRGAFWTPSATVLSSASKMYDRIVRSIFANGEQGFAYDPNDLTTLFQDTAGTIPVTSTGQPVGLMLDKSKGLVLRGEVLTNNWNLTGHADWTYADGVLTKVATTAGGGPSQMSTTSFVAGQLYKIEVEVSNLTGGSLGVMFIGGTNSNVLYNTTNGTFTGYLYANAGNNYLRAVANSATVRGSIKIKSVKEVLGNHAYQTVSASRPILRQTPILILGSDLIVNGDFSNGTTGWGSSAATLTVADGKLCVTSTGGGASARYSVPTAVGKTYTLSLGLIRGTTPNSNQLRAGSTSGGSDVLNINIGTVSATRTAQFVAVSAITYLSIGYGETEAGQTSYWDNVTVKEVTEDYRSGRNYLEFDGVDDCLQASALDFSTTDKISLFMGVQKLSDAARGFLLNTGSNSPAPDQRGNFSIEAPSFQLTGYSATLPAQGGNWDALAVNVAPHSAVLSARLFQSAAVRQDGIKFRVNGVTAPVAGGALNTLSGNFSNLPLFIGRRGGQGLPFNGRMYSLLGVGRLTTDTETIAVEREIAKRTGVTLNV